MLKNFKLIFYFSSFVIIHWEKTLPQNSATLLLQHKIHKFHAATVVADRTTLRLDVLREAVGTTMKEALCIAGAISLAAFVAETTFVIILKIAPTDILSRTMVTFCSFYNVGSCIQYPLYSNFNF